MSQPSVLLAYLDALRGTVLSAGFRERISARERFGEYPFSHQNIYRVLFAAAPVLRRGWMAIAAQRPLDAGDPALGTSLRCFRYLHVLLLNPLSDDCHAAMALEPIAVRAMRVASQPDCFCPRGAVGEQVDVPVDLAIRLATSLRQYADLRWLGQHDQGFAGKPPRRSPTGELAYTRCFGRLPPALGLTRLEVSIIYKPADRTKISFDPFRGEITMPPPRDSAVRAHIATPEASQSLQESTAKELLMEAIAAVRAAPATQPAEAAAAEPVVAGIFGRELCDAAASRGIDPGPWRDEIAARLPYAAPVGVSLTEAYLDTLSQSVETWRALLCAGN